MCTKLRLTRLWPSLRADQRHEHTPVSKRRGEVIAVAGDDDDLLPELRSDRHDEPGAVRQLRLKAPRYMRCAGGDENPVVRRGIWISGASIADDDADVAISELFEAFTR